MPAGGNVAARRSLRAIDDMKVMRCLEVARLSIHGSVGAV
jgi:hypothetical protein